MNPTQDQEHRPGDKDEMDIIKNHLKTDRPASTHLPEWRTFPEIPTARDLNPDWTDAQEVDRIEKSLLPNDWQKPWPDKNQYLETHYRLQREEAISLLRYSIKKYRECHTMIDDNETCVYTKVFVQGYLMTRLGPMCRVQFSTERAQKKIRWTQTRRLTAGSLVVISTAQDGFKTICLPAIIADHRIRDGLDQTPPTIQIFWANTDDAILDPTTELVMLESRAGYFEAVRYSMVGLQHVASTATPLDKYLVGLDKSDLAAKYVTEFPDMNIASLVHHVPNSADLSPEMVRQHLREAKESWSNYHVIDGIDDRISPYTNLDNSQLSAVHRILTKELAIVQGPPGTGKTFTSVQALQILLDSQERGSNVIVVAAQTNHAVDQILTQLIKLGFNTVRLGGRTQNEDIKRYNMYNLRRRAMPLRSQADDRDFKTLEAARKRNTARLQEIVTSVFSDDLIDPAALRNAGIITEKQFESLSVEDDWLFASSEDTPQGALARWLGDQRIETPSMDACEPEFDILENDDKADFEAEDYDINLDDCIADDDDDRGRVKGRWIPTKHQWTGANPRHYNENDLAIRQEVNRENLWDIANSYRGAIYQYWQRELVRLRVAEFRAELASCNRICRNLKANRWLKDLQCVKMAEIEIIGCTTTGLCKYRGLLAALKPRTMLIEEAAETKEANILSALYPSLQQLILVGDHQQLAPICDTPLLDLPPYNLRVSMFERLVRVNMPYTMLNMQRRMNPILRELLNPKYPNLKDHPVVALPGARPPIPGMAIESFFFHHTWTEGADENFSKFNVLEAEMIVHFIEYLLMNGVPEREITVLTFYRGQRKKILSEFRKKQRKDPFTNVHTVDSYQGEENDIVILSLVRSNGLNGPHVAGFLQDSNRGVVSISRARRGLYIFGNIINLLFASEESCAMWDPVQQIFRRQKRFAHDSKLPITCQQHNRTTWISHPDEWINHHGGCVEPCQELLGCGHECGRRCHWIPHDRLICLKPCENVLNCGHRCQRECGERCVCTCEGFTGAYPTDETWDDNLAPDSSDLQAAAAPFAGYDWRVGRLRGSHNKSSSSRLEAQASTNWGSQRFSAKSDTMVSQGWAEFADRPYDTQQPEEHQHYTIHSSANDGPDGQNAVDTMGAVRESFRQVTLKPGGERDEDFKEVGCSNGALVLWSDQSKNTVRENASNSDVTQDAEGSLVSGDTVDTDNMHDNNSMDICKGYQRGSSGISGADQSTDNRRISPNRPSTSSSAGDQRDLQQGNRVLANLPPHSPRMNSNMPGVRGTAEEVTVDEDKPEWVASSMANSNGVEESRRGDLKGNEENLIEL